LKSLTRDKAVFETEVPIKNGGRQLGNHHGFLSTDAVAA
jgi:hypothetical protein